MRAIVINEKNNEELKNREATVEDIAKALYVYEDAAAEIKKSIEESEMTLEDVVRLRDEIDEHRVRLETVCACECLFDDLSVIEEYYDVDGELVKSHTETVDDYKLIAEILSGCDFVVDGWEIYDGDFVGTCDVHCEINIATDWAEEVVFEDAPLKSTTEEVDLGMDEIEEIADALDVNVRTAQDIKKSIEESEMTLEDIVELRDEIDAGDVNPETVEACKPLFNGYDDMRKAYDEDGNLTEWPALGCDFTHESPFKYGETTFDAEVIADILSDRDVDYADPFACGNEWDDRFGSCKIYYEIKWNADWADEVFADANTESNYEWFEEPAIVEAATVGEVINALDVRRETAEDIKKFLDECLCEHLEYGDDKDYEITLEDIKQLRREVDAGDVKEETVKACKLFIVKFDNEWWYKCRFDDEDFDASVIAEIFNARGPVDCRDGENFVKACSVTCRIALGIDDE